MDSLRATNPKKMRAIGFEVEEMMKLFLVIIIGLVVVIIIIGASGGIKQLLDDFCVRNPNICGQTSTQTDRNMAKASFNALVIAHNCALDPSTCLCIKPNIGASCIINPNDIQENSGSSGGLFGSSGTGTSKIIGGGISGFQTIKPGASTSKEVKVECDTSSYTQTEAKTEVISSCDECKCTQANCKKAECSSSPTNPYTGFPDVSGIVYTTCTLTFENKGALDCKVINFNMPDNFKGITGTAKEYISGFGDPNFLVYFQKFPQGEDRSWVSWSAWYEGVGAVMMVTMCAGSLAKPVTKLINILRPSKSADTIAAITTQLKKDKDYVIGVYQKSKVVPVTKWRDVTLDSASQQFLKMYKVSGTTAQESYIVNEFSSKAFIQNLGADSIAWVKANWKPEMAKAAAYATAYSAVDAEASYALSRIDSEVGKFVYDNPKSLVLGIPLAKQQPAQLKNLEYDNAQGAISKLGKPVILDKSTPVSFALASPCRADLTIKNVNVICGYYSYDQLTGNVQCLNPQITSSTDSQLKCGDFTGFKQGSAEYRLSEKFYNSLQGMMNDKTISSYKGHEIQRLRMPSATSATFLQDIQRSPCSGVSSSLVCYKANLYEGGQKKIEGLQIVCAIDYASLVAGIANPNRAKYVNMLGNLFKSNSNEGYSNFCMVYNDPKDTGISDAFAQYKKDAGIQGISSMEAGEIIWVKDKPYSDEWKWVDGYNTGAGDEYYDNGKEKYYPVIFGMAIFSGDPGRSSLAFFKDGNLGISVVSGTTYVDSKWKEFALFANQISDNWISGNAKAFVFDDQDANGAIDSVSYWNCWANGVATKVDATNYKSTTDNPNFCYAVDPWVNGVATTTAVFAIDALAKRVPHPATWIASTAANCLLGVAQLASRHNWPEGGIGG